MVTKEFGWLLRGTNYAVLKMSLQLTAFKIKKKCMVARTFEWLLMGLIFDHDLILYGIFSYLFFAIESFFLPETVLIYLQKLHFGPKKSFGPCSHNRWSNNFGLTTNADL